MIQNKWTLLKYNNSIISSIGTQLSSKPLSIDFLDNFPYPNYPYLSEYVLFVNCVVIVYLFDFRWLDDNESKENGSRSQPSNGDRDYTTRDEDEESYDIAKPGKPSFYHTITQFYNACLLAFKEKCITKIVVTKKQMSRDVLLNKCIQTSFLDDIRSIKLSLPLRTLYLSGC
jgi:hypothetical protein